MQKFLPMLRTPLIMLLVVASISCEEEKTSVKGEGSSIIDHQQLNGSKWKVVRFVDLESNKATLPTKENSWDLDIVITFTAATSPALSRNRSTHVKGTFEGHNTSNSIKGTYEFISIDSVNVPGYASSRAGQPKWGTLFDINFNGRMRCSILGDQLTFSNKKKHAVVFRRQ